MPPATDLPQGVDWSFVQKRQTCHHDSVVGKSRWPDINLRETVFTSDDHIQPATSQVRRCRRMLWQPKLIQYEAEVGGRRASRILKMEVKASKDDYGYCRDVNSSKNADVGSEESGRLKIAFGWLGSEFFISDPAFQRNFNSSSTVQLCVMFHWYHGVPNDLNAMQPKLLGSRWGGQYTLKSVFGWLGFEFFISAPQSRGNFSF